MLRAAVLMLLGVQVELSYGQLPDTAVYELPPVVTTALRTPLSGLRVPRALFVIDANALRDAGIQSVEEALQRYANVDVQSRGPFGVQSDVSIRGSSYTQSLVLVNGVPVNDPQTAHHNFDLPVALDQVERVEVLEGPGSAQYGSGACGGIVNVITRSTTDRTASLWLSGGAHGLLNAGGTVGFSSNGIHSLNTVERQHSDGYRYDTDFSIINVSSTTTVDFSPASMMIVGGFTDKDFGAFDFYSPGLGIPSREQTTTAFASVSSRVPVGSMLVAPQIYYRRHHDHFLFDERTPGLFVNTHTAQAYGGELNSSVGLGDEAMLVAGVAVAADRLRSSNLGNHHRDFLGVHAAVNGVVASAVTYDAGIREDLQGDERPQWDPTVSVGYLFGTSGKLFATAARSFRQPSYTELYYNDPANSGNPDLRPEIAWSYEAGGSYFIDPAFSLAASLFLRNQSDLIDYVQYFSGDKYHAVNYTTAVTRGMDMSLRWRKSGRGWVEGIMLAYTFLNSRIDRGSVFSSKYALIHPRHQVTIGISGRTPGPAVTYSLSTVYKVREEGVRYTLISAKLSKTFLPVTVSLQGTNLLNQSYAEIPGIPLPGRWLWAECSVIF